MRIAHPASDALQRRGLLHHGLPDTPLAVQLALQVSVLIRQTRTLLVGLLASPFDLQRAQPDVNGRPRSWWLV